MNIQGKIVKISLTDMKISKCSEDTGISQCVHLSFYQIISEYVSKLMLEHWKIPVLCSNRVITTQENHIFADTGTLQCSYIDKFAYLNVFGKI